MNAVIDLVEIKNVEKLEETVNCICPQNESWKLIVEMEKEMREAGGKETVIAHKIADSEKSLGLIQYTFKRAGFLHKEQIIIHLLTFERYSADMLREVYSYLIEQYQLSGQLIHVIQEEERTEIYDQLIAEGFKENRKLKYGYGRNGLCFVKDVK